MFNSVFRSDRADIFVEFTNGTTNPSAPGLPCYLPGENAVGIIEITPAEDIACKKLLVRLKWRTEGRGDTDQEVMSEVDAFSGTLSAGIVKSIPFRFLLPNEPWSYAGHYINIVWGIEIDVDVPWKVNLRHFAAFILAPAWANEGKVGLEAAADARKARILEDR